MSAYLVLVIQAPKETIQSLNDKCQEPTKPDETINELVNFLNGINGGAYPASVQVTTRDSDPSVSTSGTGSEQFSYNKL